MCAHSHQYVKKIKTIHFYTKFKSIHTFVSKSIIRTATTNIGQFEILMIILSLKKSDPTENLRQGNIKTIGHIGGMIRFVS